MKIKKIITLITDYPNYF